MHRFVIALSLWVAPAVVPVAHAAPSRAPRPPAAVRAAVAPAPPDAPFAHTPTPPKTPWGGDVFAFATGQGRLGAQVSSMTPELRQFFGVPKDKGILVHKIVDDSPAHAAGLAVGDVVVEVDGDPVTELHDVARAMADRGAGDEVAIVVVRNKKRRTLTATVDRDDRAASFFRHSWSSSSTDVDVADTLRAIERRLDALEGGAPPSEHPKEKPAKKKPAKKKPAKKKPAKQEATE